MSYTFKRAIGALRTGSSGLMDVDILNMTLKDFYTDYVGIKIVLVHPVFKKDVLLDGDYYYTELSSFTGSIVNWLITKGEEALITTADVPAETLSYVIAGDLQLHGYRINPGDHLRSKDDQDDLSPSNAPDIRVTFPSITKDYPLLQKSGLFAVNGHFCRSLGFTDGLYLLGAGKNYLVNNNTHVNCLDFTNIGTLTTTPFVKENISFVESPGYSGIFLNIPDYEENKTLWLVIAGRLYTGNEILKRVGETTFKLNVRLTDIADRLFESLDYIDLSPTLQRGREAIKAEDLYSNDFVLSMLLNINSFMVVIDQPYVGVTVEPVSTYTYPTTFRSEETIRHPLMLDNGLFPAYIARYQDNVMLMDVDIRLKPKRVNDLTGVDNGGDLFHKAVSKYHPHDLVKGYFFKIHALKDES